MIPPKETFTLFKFKIDIEHKFKMFKIRFQILELNFPKVDGKMSATIFEFNYLKVIRVISKVTCLWALPSHVAF
jgi:hypothetical protein